MKITLDMYKMSRFEQYKSEWTQEIEDNATNLLHKVNCLLNDLEWTKEIQVSSGWRPAGVNAKVRGAAPKSGHVIGKAVDLTDDKDQTLGKLIASKPELLRKYGLFLEDLGSTKGWIHLDIISRSDRSSRTFKP